MDSTTLFVTFFQAEILKELQKARLEVENVKRQMLQQEISFNIQQTEALTRYAEMNKNENLNSKPQL